MKGVNLRTYIPLRFWNETLNAVGVSLTVSLNILITSLITFRLIRAHRRLSRALPYSTYHAGIYCAIVAILVESAAPIGIFGIGVVVTRLMANGSDTAWKAAPVFNILYDAAAVRLSTSPPPILLMFVIRSLARSLSSSALQPGSLGRIRRRPALPFPVVSRL